MNESFAGRESRRRCIFCGEPADSREHAIPEWLSKRMNIRELGFHPGHFSADEGLMLRPLIKCEHLKTKQVCKRCNNGWMSELEGWAQARLDPSSNQYWVRRTLFKSKR